MNYFYDIANKNLRTHFKTLSLEGFGIEARKLCISSAGALISYLQETQKTSLTHINKIRFFSTNDVMLLDRATTRNLEIVNNIRDNSTKDTLLNVLDRTFTPSGSRLLRKWLLNPLLDIKEISKRLDAVDFLFRNILIRQELKEQLEKVKDIERLISRINYGNANARDMIALKASIEVLPEIKVTLANPVIPQDALLKRAEKIDTDSIGEMAQLIISSIKEDPPLSITEGSIIKKGYNKELDELHDICINGRKYIKDIDFIGNIHKVLSPLEESLPAFKEEILEMCEDVIAK